MGQYQKIINLDHRFYFEPEAFLMKDKKKKKKSAEKSQITHTLLPFKEKLTFFSPLYTDPAQVKHT